MVANEVKLEIGLSEQAYESLVKFANAKGSTVQRLVHCAVDDLLEDIEEISAYEDEKANGTLVASTLDEVRERLEM